MAKYPLIERVDLVIRGGNLKYIVAAELEALFERHRFRYSPDAYGTIWNLACAPTHEGIFLGGHPIVDIVKDTPEGLLREILALCADHKDGRWIAFDKDQNPLLKRIRKLLEEQKK